jgi:hypothetical protein
MLSDVFNTTNAERIEASGSSATNWRAAIRVRSRDSIEQGHRLTLTKIIIELGAHEVMALLPALAAQLDCSRKCAVRY